MTQLACLRCKQPVDAQVDQCPHCGERVTSFQRTYSSKLLDGKYQILDRLGIGGMGEIFKVRHIHLNELRVVKIMRPNVAADDQGLQRFLQEARTSTMIKHRNLAMLYDFSTLDDGSYYMVWEFIDGTNIQKWIAQNGPIPARLCIEIAIQALTGLEHLHSMGLIHRDISPENIMLSQDHHGKLLVKVIDFGIAKQLAEGDGGHGLTQTGMFLGKLKYASPEQAGFLKENEYLDPRSDLYSFGIVMYEMLAGRAPFQATNPHGYILKHVTEKPAPIAELVPGTKVPAQLESIIMRSLEKNRDQRFATAADFVAALEAIRNTIQPEAKYGLGERMVTLSGAKTLTDAAAGTLSGATMQRTSPGGTQTRIAGDEPTVMERGGTLGGGTLGGATQMTRGGADEATIIDRPTMSSSNDATVVERFTTSGAAPTVVERMGYGASAAAEPTVIESKIGARPGGAPAPAKSRTPLIAAAAVLVIALVAGGWFFLHKPQPSVTATGTAGTATTASTSTVSTTPAGQGTLLLSASPWGDLEKIVREKDNKPVDLTDENRSTPTAINLEPGTYKVTMNGPSGAQTFDVEIAAGEKKPVHKQLEPVNFDQLEKEMTTKETPQ